MLDDAVAVRDEATLSLTEVAAETGIAMPILLRYTRQNPGRIPAVGSGSQLRFPPEAIDIFRTLAAEEGGDDLPRNGGFGLLSLPRVKNGGSSRPRAAAATAETAPAAAANDPDAPAAAAEEPAATGAAEAEAPAETGPAVLSLGDISDKTGIPYPTLARYASRFSDRIPHVGEGRARRFPEEAVEVFRHIRATSRRGRPPGSTNKKKAAIASELAERITALERAQEALRSELAAALEELRRHARAAAPGEPVEA